MTRRENGNTLNAVSTMAWSFGLEGFVKTKLLNCICKKVWAKLTISVEKIIIAPLPTEI